MRHQLYNRFIKPVSQNSEQAEREVVLNYLLVSVFTLALVTCVITLLAPLLSRVPHFSDRLIGMSVTTLFVIGLYTLARYRHMYKLVAGTLTLLIAAFGCFVALQWGMFDPYSALLLSLAIVMAGILISARYSLYLAAGITVILSLMQHGQADNSLHPDRSWASAQPAFGDVIGFAAILFIIAFVSWLFNRQMERSLKRAQRSEKALQRQKDLLEIKVEKRARQLEEAQLEKMQQVYRFAELGQLSTALFHDLANHLSTVNLDIEGLSAQGQPDIMRRIQQNVGHINSIVHRVRQQIGGKNSLEVFDVLDEIREVIKILEPTAKQAKTLVNIEVDPSIKGSLSCKGDITRFRQIILNLICNGIEAYPDPLRQANPVDRPVNLVVKRQNSNLLISFTDYGRGIRQSDRVKIFDPFYTTKKKGVGIGLFIVKQVTEKDFGGELTLVSSKQAGTTFTVSLPKSYYAKTNDSQ